MVPNHAINSKLSFGIASIIFAFFYNKFYIKDLLNKGYTPASEVD